MECELHREAAAGSNIKGDGIMQETETEQRNSDSMTKDYCE